MTPAALPVHQRRDTPRKDWPRPVPIWDPDMRTPAFGHESHLQGRLLLEVER